MRALPVRTAAPALTPTSILLSVCAETGSLGSHVQKVRTNSNNFQTMIVVLKTYELFPLFKNLQFQETLVMFVQVYFTKGVVRFLRIACSYSSRIFYNTGYSDATFLATFDVYTLTPTNPILFDYALYNTGGHYDHHHWYLHCSNKMAPTNSPFTSGPTMTPQSRLGWR